MKTIEGICTVFKGSTEFKNKVSRDENGVFQCEMLKKNGRCSLDKGKCHSRLYLPYLAAIDANKPFVFKPRKELMHF